MARPALKPAARSNPFHTLSFVHLPPGQAPQWRLPPADDDWQRDFAAGVRLGMEYYHALHAAEGSEPALAAVLLGDLMDRVTHTDQREGLLAALVAGLHGGVPPMELGGWLAAQHRHLRGADVFPQPGRAAA